LKCSIVTFDIKIVVSILQALCFQLEFEWILTTPFCHNKSMAIVTICGDLIFDVAIYIIYMRIDFFFLKSKKKGFCKENPSCTNLPK
jgi:hypothetical protein